MLPGLVFFLLWQFGYPEVLGRNVLRRPIKNPCVSDYGLLLVTNNFMRSRRFVRHIVGFVCLFECVCEKMVGGEKVGDVYIYRYAHGPKTSCYWEHLPLVGRVQLQCKLHNLKNSAWVTYMKYLACRNVFVTPSSL